jgi:hypothetical protein
VREDKSGGHEEIMCMARAGEEVRTGEEIMRMVSRGIY